MPLTVGLLLALSFAVSLLALAGLIWAISNHQLKVEQEDAYTIFAEGEAGTPDVDTPKHAPEIDRNQYDVRRAGLDVVSRPAVLLLVGSGVFWLVIGSAFGLLASLKLHLPDLLTEQAFFTFGRARTVHLNLVAYGWLSMTGIAVAMWVAPRIFHTPLRFARLPVVGAILWNIGVASGAVAIANGWTDGEEWLEIPWQIDILLAVAGAFFVVPLLATAARRDVDHIYVTGWYYLAALCWFPILFAIANIPYIHSGAQEATVNWWFAHNVLGLWLTPLGVGAAYYFIPKIIGKPIYSYSLSLLGFWGLALFYSQVGMHHLIGGPVPTWVVTLSIVHSVMMFIPVIAVAINQHGLVARNLWAVKESLPLRFIAFGALMYTLASFQGSIEALRSVNSVTHFTHYTVGHAHLGAYGFVSLIMFGAIYYMLPRTTGRAWPWPRAIAWHFWLVVVGFTIYFVSLTAGGLLQGFAMLDATRPFADSVRVTLVYLEWRSVGGALMTAGHLLLGIHVLALLARGPAWVPQTGYHPEPAVES